MESGLESDWENVLRATRGGTGVIRRPNAVFTEGWCVSGLIRRLIHRLIHRVIPGSKGDPGGRGEARHGVVSNQGPVVRVRIGDGSLGVNQPSHRPRADKRINRRDFDLASSHQASRTVPPSQNLGTTTGLRDRGTTKDIWIS